MLLAPLFCQKERVELCLCVDFQNLNKIIIKNQYPILDTNILSDKLMGAQCFSKVDFRNAFNQICIKAGDE